MVRAPFYDKNGVKKGAWNKEEDKKLRDYIQKYGHWNWRELPKFAGLSRCGKSCRLRWMNYLRSDLKRGNYTKQEEDTIVKLHDEYGNKWSMIAAHLPGRTDNEIKNHWHTHLKNRGKPNPKPNNTKKSNESSEYGSIKSMEHEVETNIASILPSLQILESSPLSPETSSITHLSSSSYSVVSPDIQWGSEDFTVLSDSCAHSSGDFWTEPFVADNTYFANAYPSPLSPYDASYGDSMEMFYQLMREL